MYGGYLSDSWRTFRSDYWTDNVAFLYKLYTTGNWKPLRFPHKEKLILKTVLTDHGFIHCLHFKHQLRWMKNHLPTFTVSARLIFWREKIWHERRDRSVCGKRSQQRHRSRGLPGQRSEFIHFINKFIIINRLLQYHIVDRWDQKILAYLFLLKQLILFTIFYENHAPFLLPM